MLPDGVAAPDVLVRAADWYVEVSGGAVQLEFDVVRVDAGDPAWSRLSDGWRWPTGADAARGAAHELVAGLPRPARDHFLGSVVLIMAPGNGIHPHTWRFRHGGVHLGQRRWCRRYALLATNVPLAPVVHELGHLLFGWPDLAANGVGFDCIMATGALITDDRPAPWPCAPLRVGAGWVTPRPVRAETRVEELRHADVGEFHGLLIERRDDRLVAYSTDPVRVETRTAAADPSRPVLAVLADVSSPAARAGAHPPTEQWPP